jgi:hypothetical protein
MEINGHNTKRRTLRIKIGCSYGKSGKLNITRCIALVFTRVKQNLAPHTAINKPEQLNDKSISFFKEGVFFWLR